VTKKTGRAVVNVEIIRERSVTYIQNIRDPRNLLNPIFFVDLVSSRPSSVGGFGVNEVTVV
jgi:hypothetical protein